MGNRWEEIIKIIYSATSLLANNDYSQPLKPYLKYGNKENRIIAMPAYLGGEFKAAGIKWIASFPENLYKKIPRANSVTILNDSSTGVPLAIINTVAVSIIRTAGVSGSIIKKFLETRTENRLLTIGIIGFGPIGKNHLSMIDSEFSNSVKTAYVYDLDERKKEELPDDLGIKVKWEKSWNKVYRKSDILITCTVSKEPYIDEIPPKGSLQLNVSLRDYKADLLNHMDYIIVDDWDEVCRANTDIERMHSSFGLNKEDTFNINEVLFNKVLNNKKKDEVVMFNPMGMAIFDIAVANYYFRLAQDLKIGIELT
jgi:ornithine cyclodeaminase